MKAVDVGLALAMLLATLPPALAVALPRRAVCLGAGSALTVAAPCRSMAAGTQVVAPGFEAPRVEGVGGGTDLLSETPKIADVTYPPFLNGTWSCQRLVQSVEGDAGQAQGAWKLLGGSGDIREAESYAMRFVDVRTFGNAQSITGLDGRTYFATVLDRGFDIDSRVRGANVSWDVRAPNTLTYQRDEGGRGSAAELTVVQRSVEQPSESNKGWGSNELLRVTTSAGSLFGDLSINYAARVRRRWRRGGVTPDGVRVVEGLEIVTTYRVLDGIAGTEYPTSTTKATIRLTRRDGAAAE